MSSGGAIVRKLVDRLLLGPRRRRRWMERRLAELDRLDQGRRPKRRRAARGGAVTIGAFIIFVAGTALMLRNEYGVRVSAEGIEGAQRLIPAVPIVESGGSYEFATTDGSEPVRYSPCRRLS